MAGSGMIKWFSNSKGFGFIVNEDGPTDIFVHYSSIVSEGYRTLKTGQIVNYEVKQGEKGLHAENVIPIGQKRRHRKHF
ncbi:MAG: cold-shock protein [Porticoccaceae bacterium]|nr:cold shock domain protein CspD [Porticoccaceae bacterium]RPG85236.1 MAG: cold-shock protein [Cellvibrionales bacterium TMED47]|tara:strand:- start:12111 stop:12347 length:237 start_codon:yes stop_codon:yes gene_type:complete